LSLCSYSNAKAAFLDEDWYRIRKTEEERGREGGEEETGWLSSETRSFKAEIHVHYFQAGWRCWSLV
jgi:hypothetical protein